MKRQLIILALAAMLLGGCKADKPDEPAAVTPDPAEPSTYAMAFTPQSATAEGGTAAPSRDAAADEVAEALGKSFAVATWKTNAGGGTEFVMAKDPEGNSAYIVDYSSARGWYYADRTDQYLKYWDLSARDYTFYAVANATAPAFSGGFADIGTVSVDDPASADLMESYYRRDGINLVDYDLWTGATTAAHYIPTAKGTIPAYADIVPLPFHRVLSQVQFKIFNKSPQPEINVSINRIMITIHGDDYIYKTGNYNNFQFESYDNTSKQTVFRVDDVTDTYIYSGRKNATLLSQTTVLPQPLLSPTLAPANISADVQIFTDIGIFTGTIDLGEAWDKGTVYTYYLTISYSENIILVEHVDIDPWEVVDEIENTQTNW